MTKPSAERKLAAAPGDETQTWMLVTGREKKRAWPLVLAIAFHALLLLIQLPSTSTLEAEPEVKARTILVQAPRFKAPEPEIVELKPPRARRQPVPDLTPDAPEPLVQDVEIRPVLDLPSTDEIFQIPDGPPPPEVTGPLVIRGDIRRPVVLERVQPGYTELARRARREGIVVIKAVIDTEGRVVDLEILKPLGFGLDEAALKAARQWRFTPATLHGKPVPVYMNLSVIFRLN